MPLMEAMALGVPIAASWRTCIPEVAGEAALLFDPQQPQSICDALLAITQDYDARACSRPRRRGWQRSTTMTR